jgi:hypothetical protein
MARVRTRDPLEDLDWSLRALLRGGSKPLGLGNLDLLSSSSSSDLPQVEKSLRFTGDLIGSVDLTATIGAQVFKEAEGEIRGSTALAFGGLKGGGLEGRLMGYMGVAAGPRTSAEFALRYRGLLDSLDMWGGSLTEVGVFEKKGEGEKEEHVLVEGLRRVAQARAQITGRATADIAISDIGVRGRFESLGQSLELKAFEVMREAQVQQAREAVAREARSFVALRAQFESERSRIAAILSE